MATGYYTELAAEYAWQLVPLLRPKYRFFPGRRREPKKYGRGWYVFDEASGRWKYLDDITWLVLGHLAEASRRLWQVVGKKAEGRCRALESFQAAIAVMNALQRDPSMQMEERLIPPSIPVSRRDMMRLVNGQPLGR
jgi:hypothetical protein